MNTNYYTLPEVSNSDLTALKEALYPCPIFGDREAAFRFGSLVDAIITEPSRVDFFMGTVDGTPADPSEWRRAMQMRTAFRAEATRDNFLASVIERADTQHVSIRHAQPFAYCQFPFTLDTRCKWDFWLGSFGGDLKTTSAATQAEFERAIDAFDWDRSRAWYMDIVGSDYDFIYAISKKNNRIFKKFITRNDPIYRSGRDKYTSLAFKYWCLAPQQTTNQL